MKLKLFAWLLKLGSPLGQPNQSTPHPRRKTYTVTKILVLYYSTHGHIETMAEAVANGARSTGAKVIVKRVPESMPDDVARQVGAKINQPAEIATPDELAEYDAIIIGTPTRFGRMSGQMANFLDQTGGFGPREN